MTRKARLCIVSDEFREDLSWWVKNEPRLALQILKLVDAVLADPLKGIGKPEPLKHQLAGVWSRRINTEHRLLYIIEKDRILFVAARYHYA
jgi:toxin YoeB